MKNKVPKFEEFVNEVYVPKNIDKNLPKLGKENMAAAEAVLQALKKKPGMTQIEIQRVIGSNKGVLKNFSDPGKAHYKNFQNIFWFLFGTYKIKSFHTKKEIYYYLTNQEVSPEVLKKVAEYQASKMK